MFGAILGDMIGSPYEFDQGKKSKHFPLFVRQCQFTDDSVMTLAVAEALLQSGIPQEQAVKQNVVDAMQKWGHRYPNAGYGIRFSEWLQSENPQPYNSWGNGSAMRVSAVGWLYDSLEITRQVARWTAEVTHNHPEGIKGAEATAAAIWLARNGKSKEELREYVEAEFGYDLSRCCDEIRPSYCHVESCQQTVPEAMIAFFEGRDFEDVVRTAVSLGGDCDTLTCIAASIAEAYYGVPRVLRDVVLDSLPEDLKEIISHYESCAEAAGREFRFENPLITNWRIEEASANYARDSTNTSLVSLLCSLVERIHMDGELFIPVEFLDPLFHEEIDRNNPEDTHTLDRNVRMKYLTVRPGDGSNWAPAFTGLGEAKKGAPSSLIPERIVDVLKRALNSEALSGLMINPWDHSVALDKELLNLLLRALDVA